MLEEKKPSYRFIFIHDIKQLFSSLISFWRDKKSQCNKFVLISRIITLLSHKALNAELPIIGQLNLKD